MLALKERREEGCLGLKNCRVKGTYRHQQQRKEEQQQQRKHQEIIRLIQNLCWRTSAARPKSLGFKTLCDRNIPSLGWDLCLLQPTRQWSPVIFACIPFSCSSSFRAAVPSVLPSTLVRLPPFFVLLLRKMLLARIWPKTAVSQ